ncbi:MAG: D-glycerate dehydrogenase [Thermoplasmatales archaeon]|nr:D-glycerate dehydrogenase [Thermoplasmatales archaeon]
MAKIFITRRLPDEGMELLKGHEIEIYEGDTPPSKEEIIEGVRGKDALICLLTDKIDAEVMENGKNLKVIANYAVGIDNIDIAEATKRGIFVTNTPGVLTETVADLAWALMMAIARRIVEGDEFMRQKKFKGWAPMLLLGRDIYGKTLGVIGLGRIGKAFARRASGFSMKILYYSRKRDEEFEKETGANFVSLKELLEESDFVSLHLPLTKETYHIIGEKELKMMKKTAYLINTSRGKCIDEKALIKALKEGWIGGAALDVYENEPEVSDEILSLKNVVLAPHVGSASYETRSRMAIMVAENVLSALNGKIPPQCLNPEAVKYRKI